MFYRDFLKFLGFKGTPRAASGKHLAGHTKTTGPYGELIDADVLQCVHCRHTWEIVAGSGVARGFCSRCCGYTCGSRACMECVPYEQRLENEEAGLPRLTPRREQAAVLALPGVIEAKPLNLIIPD